MREVVTTELTYRSRAPFFDHLVGAREQRGGHVEAERLGGREINDEIEFGRLLNRDIAGLGAAQNLVDQFGSAMELSRVV